MSSRYDRRQDATIRFSRRELRDLAAAWLALSIAFTIFIGRPPVLAAHPTWAARLFVVCIFSVGVAFMLHELAHKVTAIRFGQLAEFRADYSMLGVAIVGALAGFIFAAPGAVHHVGRITDRENGIIALAGPASNVALVGAFAPLLLFDGIVYSVGAFGVFVNAFLGAFNLIPFGPLDGRTVYRWHPGVFALAFGGSIALVAGVFLTIGFPI
ncbi:peptidase M50 [Salinarchaeum sp. Harcht-Bsk1]|uniref:metalloprotease n=1 Tax=Salinarchaeum sp. Harcht-Bsk1 TaxID=1333523 RepID=UPI0003424711|nr:metalloprotease [Salinarchaeum sp. Harcht-Bsk1]AGN02652.1 peptidase M50 [Salinarchaeum sp. Harcht-Bsk1]